jgi:magnesium chelatase family protein
MVHSIGLTGLDAKRVDVSVAKEFSGVSESAAREMKVRVRCALSQVGVDPGAVAFAVTPDDSGSSLDLAAAIAALVAKNKIPASAVENTAFVGELSLTGAVRPVRGILPRVQQAAKLGFRRVVVPTASRHEAALVDGLDVFHVNHLADLVEQLGRGVLSFPVPLREQFFPVHSGPDYVDFADIRGNHTARRALEIAAVAGHNVLMIGPPDAGKTMLARRLPTVLPPLTEAEALEVTALHSVAGLHGTDRGIVQVRPFRAPYHTVSPVGLVGGGDPIRPGEISLAHRGVLFLDEILEFKRGAIEVLRDPMREGRVTISRRDERTTFPALAQVVAAANPCPCGFHGDKGRACTCSPERVASYRKRFDDLYYFPIRIHLQPVETGDLTGQQRGESSATIRARVVKAREFGRKCFTKDKFGSGGIANREASDVFHEARMRLKMTTTQELAALQVAQSIAWLDASEFTHAKHIAEAIPLAVHVK